jgi:hypothetical protein
LSVRAVIKERGSVPTDKIFPLDKLSNPIKEGDLVFLRMDEIDPLYAVLKVEPASVIHTPEGDMPVTGTVRFGLFWEVPFGPENPALCQGYCSEGAGREAEVAMTFPVVIPMRDLLGDHIHSDPPNAQEVLEVLEIANGLRDVSELDPVTWFSQCSLR